MTIYMAGPTMGIFSWTYHPYHSTSFHPTQYESLSHLSLQSDIYGTIEKSPIGILPRPDPLGTEDVATSATSSSKVSLKAQPIPLSRTPYLLRLTAAFDDEDVGIDVFYAHPVGEGQGSVSPDPVHHSPQLHQERHQAEPREREREEGRERYAILASMGIYLFIWIFILPFSAFCSRLKAANTTVNRNTINIIAKCSYASYICLVPL